MKRSNPQFCEAYTLSVPVAPQSLTIIARPASLSAVTEFVHKGAEEAGLPEERIGELDLVIDELVMNVCMHAYPADSSGDVTVTYSVPALGELSVEVADQGPEFNPLDQEPPDLTLGLADRPIGGLGVYLVKTFAKSLNYRREHGWNRLTFGISADA
jgi:anti-sigma regulatory factor (Ser/Thr protein kinase)